MSFCRCAKLLIKGAFDNALPGEALQMVMGSHCRWTSNGEAAQDPIQSRCKQKRVMAGVTQDRPENSCIKGVWGALGQAMHSI